MQSTLNIPVARDIVRMATLASWQAWLDTLAPVDCTQLAWELGMQPGQGYHKLRQGAAYIASAAVEPKFAVVVPSTVYTGVSSRRSQSHGVACLACCASPGLTD